MRQRAEPNEHYLELSPLYEGRFISLINFRHLLDGEGQTVGNGADVIISSRESRGLFPPGFCSLQRSTITCAALASSFRTI